MKIRDWTTLGATALGAAGMGVAIKSLLPDNFATEQMSEQAEEVVDGSAWPEIEISFLRCGHVNIPEFLAVRGAASLATHTNTYSAVLIRHPDGTFLYDTGFCSDIYAFLKGQSLFFRTILGGFVFEQALSSHLQQLEIKPGDLDFALLSHLHWDHVSGIPDIPGVPLRLNRVEYEAAKEGLSGPHSELVWRLMGNNPHYLFDCTGPAYMGFRSSYDLFGDGSIVLVPLPGHTPGNTGMFINRTSGRIFLLGDAAWCAENYLRPATMHPALWSLFTSDDATARQTLIDLHRFAQRHPEIPMIAMHDAALQEAFMTVEAARMVRA